MSKIKIWEINGPMNAGGTESLILEILKNKPSDAEVSLIVLKSEKEDAGIYIPTIQNMGINIECLPSVGAIGVRSFIKEFENLVNKKGKPDVIHIHLNAVSGFIAMAAKKCGIKARIVHCHADITYHGPFLSKLKSEIGLQIMRLFVNMFGTDYWACSNEAAKRLFYPFKKIVVIPNIIDVEKYLPSDNQKVLERNQLGISNDVIVVGAVGRIAKIKNYEAIIEAINILKEKNILAKFVCYGRVADEEYFKKLTKLTSQYNLENDILFKGNCDRVNEALAGFDVYVMPSITEGLGISALEAQAKGLPVITSTGVPKAVDVGLGLVKQIPFDDYSAWAKEIKTYRPNRVDKETILNAFSISGYNSKTECDKIYKRYFDAI